MCEILEAAMLLCFGFSWPISVLRNLRAGTARSMSLPFTLLIITGYLAGIAAKCLSGRISYVLGVYILNLVMVSLNLYVYFRNRRMDTERAAC